VKAYHLPAQRKSNWKEPRKILLIEEPESRNMYSEMINIETIKKMIMINK
jgi:hypothetical protein